MSDLERIREWVKTFPNMPQDMMIDYTHNDPINAGLFPQGVQEIRRENANIASEDIIVTNQYNLSVMPIFYKSPGDDYRATKNAELMMDFQQWVQEQSIMGLAPKFGNYQTDKEIIRAQNGMLYGDRDNGVSAYSTVLSIQFKKYYKFGDD